MWPNPQFSADLVTFTEEILNGKFDFLYSESIYKITMDLFYLTICKVPRSAFLSAFHTIFYKAWFILALILCLNMSVCIMSVPKTFR